MKQQLLIEYLENEISKKKMYQIIAQFAEALLETEGKGRRPVLYLESLEIVGDKVDMQFEVDKSYSILRIADFIKELIFKCVFREGEEVEDLADFLRFLDNEREVTLPYIYEYVMDELDLEIPSQYMGLYEQQENAETGVLDVSFWEKSKALQEADKIQRHSQKLCETVQPAGRVQSSDETGLLDESFWEQKMQNLTPQESRRKVSSKNISLINQKNGEETRIKGNVFVIGKDETVCNLVIANKTISRKHAELITKGSHYFIKDLGSTNKTFIGSTEIMPNVEMEIFAGTRIKFSNEVFEFVVR